MIKARHYLLCGIALLGVGGCSTRRDFGGRMGQEPISVKLEGVGTLTFIEASNRDDYLHAVFTVKNEQTVPLHFSTPGTQPGPWGVQLVPESGAATCRQEGAQESYTWIEPGKTGVFDCLWRVYPTQEGSDWKWSLRIAGLKIGDESRPVLTVAMPTYVVDSGASADGKR